MFSPCRLSFFVPIPTAKLAISRSETADFRRSTSRESDWNCRTRFRLVFSRSRRENSREISPGLSNAVEFRSDSSRLRKTNFRTSLTLNVLKAEISRHRRCFFVWRRDRGTSDVRDGEFGGLDPQVSPPGRPFSRTRGPSGTSSSCSALSSP